MPKILQEHCSRVYIRRYAANCLGFQLIFSRGAHDQSEVRGVGARNNWDMQRLT